MLDGSVSPLVTWDRLVTGFLSARINRFTAEVELADGRTVLAHCPNSGRMLTCSEPRRPVFLTPANRHGRKLPYTWEMIEMPSSTVIVNTLRANQIARKAVELGLVPELEGYTTIKSEVPLGTGSRIDLLLGKDAAPPCLVEVKSVTYVTASGRALFPDAVSERALRHVRDLAAMKDKGFRALLFFVIMRSDAVYLAPASHIDPAYADALGRAVSRGLEVVAHDVQVRGTSVLPGKNVPFGFGA